MFSDNLKLLVLLVFASLFMIACSDDDLTSDTTTVEDFQEELRRDGGPQDGPPNRDPRNANQANQTRNVTIVWTDLFLELERYAEGMRPNATARALAYINLAAYETAVSELPNYRSNEGLIRGLRIRGNDNLKDINLLLALNACYADVLDHFLINTSANLKDKINALEASIEDNAVVDVPNRVAARSKDWGASVAQQIIAYSQTDRAAEAQILEAQPLSYEPPTGEGYWTYSAEEERALFPYWERVRTFVVDADATTTQAPINYSEEPSSPYYEEMLEVYNANNDARDADGEQLWIAEFWSDDVTGITFSPPARQYAIANQLATQYDLNLGETLYLYLKLGFSLNDAAVSTWKYKYEHMVMRPNVFIHEFIDPRFQTNLYRLVPWPNPTFPGYPSGHSCFASAASGVFIDFFGDQTNFTDNSHVGREEFRGAARSYSSFSQMAAENAYSRIPLGVHIRMDCDEGIRLGYEISDGINEYQLKRDNG